MPRKTDLDIPPAWLNASRAPVIDALRYDAGGVLLFQSRNVSSPISIERTPDGERLMNGTKALTPLFRSIDSFDLSTERKEVVFSARRSNNFDVALVSADGSDIHWAPEDPADELAVQWAPRGNKISYVVRTNGGDFVRTLHVPTSTQLTTEFPSGRVRAVAWEPAATRYAVAWDSIDASSRVESMGYGGEDRRVIAPPKVQLDVAVDVIGGVRVMRPPALRYNDKLPLVVWITDDPNAWDDDRGTLQQSVAIACAVTSKPPDEAFWKAVEETPWIDSSEVFVVGSMAAGASPAATLFVGDPNMPAGRYHVEDKIVRAPVAVVKSVAGGFIANQLKGRNIQQNVRPR
ncbi:MAG: hypothetical protein ACXVJT_00180 [Thermoanaerobaculia bacterium]